MGDNDKQDLVNFIADTIRQHIVLDVPSEVVTHDLVFRKRRAKTKKTAKCILGILFATFTEGFYNLPPPKADSPPSPPPSPPAPPSPPGSSSPPPPPPPYSPSPPPPPPPPPGSSSPPAPPAPPPPPPRPRPPDPPPTCCYVLIYRGGYQTTYTRSAITGDSPNNYETETLEVQPYVGDCLYITAESVRYRYNSYVLSKCRRTSTRPTTTSTHSANFSQLSRTSGDYHEVIDANAEHIRDETTNQIINSSNYIDIGNTWLITNTERTFVRKNERIIGSDSVTIKKREICIIQYSQGGLIPRIYARGLIQAYSKNYVENRVPQHVDSYEDNFIEITLAEAYVSCDDGRFESFDFEPYAT